MLFFKPSKYPTSTGRIWLISPALKCSSFWLSGKEATGGLHQQSMVMFSRTVVPPLGGMIWDDGHVQKEKTRGSYQALLMSLRP